MFRSSALILACLAVSSTLAFSVAPIEADSPQPVYNAAQAVEDTYVEEGRSLSALNNPDKVAFIELLNTLLWNHGEEVHTDARGFEHVHTKRGILGQPMPEMFQDENSFTGRMYRQAEDACYDAVCSIGMQGFFESISEVISQFG